MKLTNILKILLCCVIILLSVIPVSASQGYLPTDEDKDRVKQEMETIVATELDEADGLSVDVGVSGYDLENIQKVYFLVGNPVKTYCETKSVEAIISDNYNFRVPVATETGVSLVAVLVEDASTGKLTFSGIGEDYLIYSNAIEKSIEKKGMKLDDIQNTIVTYSALYRTYFVFFDYENVSYCIPYTRQEEEIKIQAGQVYTTEELFNQLNKTFDETILENNPDSNGGLPYRERNIAPFIVIGFVPVVAVALIVLYKVRKKKSIG